MQLCYLSRRNLLTLLGRLDEAKERGFKTCDGIVKQDTKHPKYACSDIIMVAPVEDDEYYHDREPGKVRNAPNL